MASPIVISILGDARDLTRSLGTAEGKVSRFGKAAKVAGRVAGGALAAGVGLAGTALVKGFNRLQGIDQAKAKLTGLGHSAKGVSKIMQNATDAVTGTAFGLDAAAGVAASTVAAGVKPGKDLERTLKLVGDAATIAGTDMGSMGAIFNKVAASDMIQGDVIAQLGDKGIPILQFLGKELGVTAQEAKKMASAGKVDFATFQSAMTAGLGGAAQESGKTFSGAMANMNAALGRLGARVLDGVFQKMPGLFTAAGDALDKLGPVADKLGTALGAGMSAAGQAVGRLVDRVKVLWSGPAGAAVRELADRLTTTLTPAITRVIDFVRGDGASGLADFARQIATGILPVLTNLANLVTTRILPVLTTVISYVAANVAPILVAAFDVVRTHVVPILLEAATFLTGTLYPAVWGIVESVGTHLRPVFDAVVDVVQNRVLPAVAGLLEKFREWQPTIQRVIGVVVTVVGAVLKLAAAILGKVLPPVIRFAGFLLGTVVKALSTVIGWVVKVVAAVLDFGGAFVRAAARVKDGVTRVVDRVKALPGRVLDVVTGLGDDLKDAGSTLMTMLADGIKAKVSAPWDAVKGLAGRLKNLLPGSPVKTGPLRSFNGGRNGRALMTMLADGIRAGAGDPTRAMREVAAQLEAAPASVRARPAGRTYVRPHLAGTGPTATAHTPVVRVELTAQELHTLERGRRVALDLRPYLAAGGAL